ncbi:hypothetical protein P22_3006 [Propionispora sp. 2/2-37]|uniref:ABC transporter substrate-binding protein n=1 Tax=Propionispora sp. 2/2-37 TaxID=1677858 RepID=UPI0006BB5E5A|nr:ABC transporter substrate-binding protein [Propionispora sp. 2/2-37]CUH96894.1 hypothetical protein P22_3006 [Propionispora sp. 2/2-37]
MFQIGILQLTQNLDDTVRGFKAGLEKLNISAKFYYQNADGNTAHLKQLAEKLCKVKLDLFFACSTPAAAAAIELPGNIPVIFTPVFDPVGAGLVATWEKPGGKATGVAGMVKADQKISFVKKLLPRAKKIGVLYHNSDNNALLEVSNFRKAATSIFHLELLPIERPEALSKLPEILPPDLDALFLPIGRIVEENFASIVYYTDAISLPIIASHPPNVSAGALAALVADHYQLGLACSTIAKDILAGKPAGMIPVESVTQPEILLNAFAAENMGIEIPACLLKKAKEIYE